MADQEIWITGTDEEPGVDTPRYHYRVTLPVTEKIPVAIPAPGQPPVPPKPPSIPRSPA